MKQKKSYAGRLSRVVAAIDVSPIKKMELLARQTEGVISLAQGIPSFETPNHIKDAVKQAIDQDLCNRYTPGFGIEPLREAICAKLKRDNNIVATTEQIVVTHGAIQALMAIFIAILDDGAEIVILTPDYATHITQAIIAGRGHKPVLVPLDESRGWRFDSAALERAITKKTRALLLCNPSNPTGKTYTCDELKEIASIAKKHGLFIIVDEMYEYFTFGDCQHTSIGSFPEVADQTISVFGVSKSYAMTGWRIGYLVAAKELAYEIFKVQDSLITCPAAVSQYAALAALTGPHNIVSHFKGEFAKRRGIVMEMLKDSKRISLVEPQGAYYAFLKLNFPVDDFAYAKEMLLQAGVAAIPGSAFGLGGEGHLRVSFGVAEDRLREGMRRLIDYTENYPRKG